MSDLRTTCHETTGAEQTVALGAELAKDLRAGAVVALHGELGAGKTQFVRGIAQGLGHRPGLVSSPTFVVMNEYADAGARCPLVHIDAYRIGGDDDADSIGLDEALSGGGIVAIEWPERISSRLPAEQIGVWIDHAGGDDRRIRIVRPGPDAKKAQCRTCGAAFDALATTAPFCSNRCRMADLGKWFDGSHKISRELKDRDLESGD